MFAFFLLLCVLTRKNKPTRTSLFVININQFNFIIRVDVSPRANLLVNDVPFPFLFFFLSASLINYHIFNIFCRNHPPRRKTGLSIKINTRAFVLIFFARKINLVSVVDNPKRKSKQASWHGHGRAAFSPHIPKAKWHFHSNEQFWRKNWEEGGGGGGG